MMSMNRLCISFGGHEQWDIMGSEDSIREQYDSVCQALEATDGIGKKFFEFIGLRNLADRKSESMAIRLDEIRAVDIQEV